MEVHDTHVVVRVLNVTAKKLRKHEYVAYEDRVNPFNIEHTYRMMYVVLNYDVVSLIGVDPSVFLAKPGDTVDVGTSVGTVKKGGEPGDFVDVTYARRCARAS